MKTVGTGARLRAYVNALVTTAIVLVFALAEWWTEKVIAEHSRAASTVIEIAIVLVATVVFRPIHKRVEAAVEAALTKRRREAREAIAHVRRELTSFNDSAQIMRRVIEAVDRHLATGGSAMYLRRDGYRAEASSFDAPAENVAFDDALAVRLRSTARPADPRALHSTAAGAIAYPMMAGGDLIGFLCVMPKSIDFEHEDDHLLATLAEAAGLALLALDPRLRAQSLDERPNNLPAGLPALIGRDDELQEIKVLFEQGRLITLTGAGGVGKTRTALQVATDMLHGYEGAWFVDLAPLADPTLVPGTIADTLNISDDGGARPLIERICAALKTKRMLIVIDNCEHVIGAAADIVTHILKGCPDIYILATSREPLGIGGEEPYRMPSLPVPPEGEPMTADKVLEYAAAALFVARAHSAQRSFALTDDNAPIVADIVRRLDGIALAIELAAPRVIVLGLEELTRRLDERFMMLSGGERRSRTRHQTLHALIGWSYDLLSESEQALLRRSSIFRGTWSLEAAEAVCTDARVPDANVLDLISALVDKSLVVVEADGESRRYRLLESTRHFAGERLDAAGERDKLAERHARYFEQAALRAGDEYWQTDAWTAQTRRDLENYRAAVEWALSSKGDPVAAASIVGALRFLFSPRESRALIPGIAERLDDDAPPRVRGLFALAVALVGSVSGEGTAQAAQAAELLRGIDELGRAEGLATQALNLGRTGRVAESVATYDEALTVARATHSPRLLGWILSQAAYWSGANGDRVRARAQFDEAADLLRACSALHPLAVLQANRAEFLFAEDDIEGALDGARESETILRERGEKLNVALVLQNKAAYLLALGRFDDAAAAARESLMLARSDGEKHRMAVAIGHLAQLEAEIGDPHKAARLIGYVDEEYRKTSSAREQTERRGYSRAIELIRQALPEDQMLALMREGAVMQIDTAVAEALATTQAKSA